MNADLFVGQLAPIHLNTQPNITIWRFGSMVNEELTDDELWAKAEKGDPSILSDPMVSTFAPSLVGQQ